MMPFIFLLLGLLLIFLEFYTPGGIMAVLGALFLLVAIGTFLAASASPISSFLFVIGALIGVLLIIKLALSRIRKSGAENTFYLAQDQEGYVATNFDAALIGKEGNVLSDLGPSGYILVEGKRYAATCRTDYIESGKKVIVTGGEGSQLIVKVQKE